MKNRFQCWDVAPQPQSQKIQQPTSPQKPLKDLPPNRLRSKWQRIQGWNIQHFFCYKSVQSTIQSTATSSTNNSHRKTATGWLAALVKVMNLKFRLLRLRDKMLVFVGLVKKCLQCGHSCRLAGEWLKCQNLRFACAVNRFCSSRVNKNIRKLWFSIIPGKHPPIHFFLFSKLQCSSAFGNAAATNSNKATLWRHVQL